jgi:type I restriction enzyme M protein
MSGRITQAELESYLWGAATLLRGFIDAGDYKQFIFPLLFYKRLCDVYDEEYEFALKESGGDEEFAAFSENHRFIIPEDAHWKVLRIKVSNIGREIQGALRKIEKTNEMLFGVFGDAPWTNKDRLPDHMLRDLIEHFSSLNLSNANFPEDELGVGYEYLIKKFADDSGHTAAEFYTNRTVVHLMTEMLQPKSGESVYDPTCGSAGMLLSCVAHLKARNKEWRNLSICGQEINLLTSSIGRMNLFLHGIEDFKITRGDTLSKPAYVEEDRLQQFDLVLANPPYSIKQWDRDAWSSDVWGRNIYGTPPQGRADYAFFQHIICSMKPDTGRCAILFPHGVLFRNEEAHMREKLVAHDVLECIIGLGKNLFYNSSMEACIVICRMNKPKERHGKVLFIDAVNEVTHERSQSFLTDEHIGKITDAYNSYVNMGDFCKIVSVDEIKRNNCLLSLPLYVRTSIGESVAVERDYTVEPIVAEWLASSASLRESVGGILELLENNNEVYTEDEMPEGPTNEKVISLTKRVEKKREAQPAFKRAVLAAEIVSHLHREPTFGSVKFEKIFFLCEKHLGLEHLLESKYLRQVAGPYDPKAMRSIVNNLKRQKWYDKRKVDERNHFVPLEKAKGYKKYYDRYFKDVDTGIKGIISLLKKASTEQCEIIATLYSAWADFSVQGIYATDEQIVDEILQNWTESKQRIHRQRWLKALEYMKQIGLYPDGSFAKVGSNI